MENRKYSYEGKDIKQYVIQSVVVVDSVHRSCGKYTSGAVRYQYSSPYKAGLIINNITKVIVKDLDVYLSNNRILSLKRNSKKMVKMGENSEYLDFI